MQYINIIETKRNKASFRQSARSAAPFPGTNMDVVQAPQCPGLSMFTLMQKAWCATFFFCSSPYLFGTYNSCVLLYCTQMCTCLAACYLLVIVFFYKQLNFCSRATRSTGFERCNNNMFLNKKQKLHHFIQ